MAYKPPPSYLNIKDCDKLPEDVRKKITQAIRTGKDSIERIAYVYRVSMEALLSYYDRYEKPAIIYLLQRDPLTARYALEWSWRKTQESIAAVTEGHWVPDRDAKGIAMVDEEGEPMMKFVKEPPQLYGKVCDLIRTGTLIARTMGELEGNIGSGALPGGDLTDGKMIAIINPKSGATMTLTSGSQPLLAPVVTHELAEASHEVDP